MIYSQEGTTSHTWIAVSIFEFLHNLLGNIIWNKSLCRALCSKLCQIIILAVLVNIILFEYVNQLRECRCNPYTLLILDTSDTLMKHLLDNRYKILSCLTFRYLINIHKYCNKRCLSICCHKRDNLVLNYLNTTVNFFLYTLFCDNIDLLLCYRDSCFFHLLANHTTEFLTADLHKRCKMCQ